MTSVYDLKVPLKAKGKVEKSGLLPAPAPKPFKPAATKGESPKVAEKKITKKEKVMKPLMITYKKPNEAKKEKKEIPKLKKPKQTKG